MAEERLIDRAELAAEALLQFFTFLPARSPEVQRGVQKFSLFPCTSQVMWSVVQPALVPCWRLVLGLQTPGDQVYAGTWPWVAGCKSEVEVSLQSLKW